VLLGETGFSLRYAGMLGQTEAPYLVDSDHLNYPNGLVIDASDNVYVVEEEGNRALGFDITGNEVLSFGDPGRPWHDDDTIGWPKDIAVNPISGNIWVSVPHAIKEIDSAGSFVRWFPESEPWVSGSDNDRFNEPRGLTFDSSGRLFVADEWNSRVQIYTFDVDGNPVYDDTIPGFDRPAQVVVDSLERLYITEVGAFRVMRCTETTGWSCAVFHGTGSEGSGADELSWAFGLGIDGSDNIYIADGMNGRVKKCNSAGVCSTFASGFAWPADVAVDSSDNVYVSDYSAMTIEEFTSAGGFVGTFAGTDGVPYLTDSSLLNRPWGVSIAADGGLYVTESGGRRLIKLSALGAQEWTVGQLGLCASGDYGLCNPEGNAATGPGGRVYLADTWNHRIQIYDSDGTYYATFGSYGDGDYEFDCPSGVGFNPVGGDMYVVDRCNQRIQVFSSSHLYETTLGVLDEPGDDSAHLDNPRGVAFDGDGHVYVADNGNQRVQECTRTGDSFSCSTFAGVTDVFGWEFDYLNPTAVAVDGQGRVYVADEWNSRLQVFDSAGAYLTSIGGAWGAKTGDTRGPLGVAVGGNGRVYTADTYNHRILTHARGVPDWRQININGFGSPTEAVWALAPLGSSLYAGTWTSSGEGAQIWRRSGSTWSNVMSGGFGNPLNQAIDHLIEFDGALYAGTYNWDDDAGTSDGGEIWRSTNGTLWTQVVDAGFGDPDNAEAFRFAVFDGDLYVGTCSGTETAGGEVWRSASGDLGTWTQSVANGFGDATNNCVLALEPHGGYLYVGTLNRTGGGEVWRSPSGDPGTWLEVGSASTANTGITALAEFNGDLYILTTHTSAAGGEVWRCHDCDGSDFEQVVDNGLANACNRSMSALEVVGQRLYWVTGQSSMCNAGLEVWWSSTGDDGDWHQVGYAGFGDSNNRAPYWDNSVVAFNDMLVVGTHNVVHGGEVWVRLNDLFLPLVMRNHP
jgi:hypothetical protein